ncbi:Hypothetical predicted protein [Olea europaea subsp. europaea]|uniref:Uncharacterized protein n=1 Tax=Olea europaea subsp. europaea TaxID=158383 RepID=A0A8S0VM93_OLEEU|nr:Hypothetical predicted protein [Olea europaea subsp. europaea]
MQDFDLGLAAFSQTPQPVRGSSPLPTTLQTHVPPPVLAQTIQSSSNITGAEALELTPQPAVESTNYFQNTSGNRKSLRKGKWPGYLKDVFVVDTLVHKIHK